MITFRNPLSGIFDSIATLSRRYAFPSLRFWLHLFKRWIHNFFGSTFLKGRCHLENMEEQVFQQ
jgi:hypothetical protein